MIGGYVWVLLLGRVLQGVAFGFVLTALPIYVGEIATDNVRGALGSLVQLFIVLGVLYVNCIGPYVSYQTLQWCCLVPPIVFAGIFVFIPESPFYYAGKGRQEESLKSLQFLRGKTADVLKDEMSSIVSLVEQSMAQKGSIMDLIKIPGNRKALLICTGLLVFQQCSGTTTLQVNTQSIFQSADTNLDPAIESIIYAAVQVVASCITPLIADRLGRKVVLLFAAIVMSIALAALGAFFFMKLEVGETSHILWIPLPAMVIYNIVYCVSFGSLPWAIVGEIFPSNVKSIAGCIVACTCFGSAFLITYFYPALDALGAYYAFWLFALSCVVAFFFVLFIVIETKGLSLQEIQDKLNNKTA